MGVRIDTPPAACTGQLPACWRERIAAHRARIVLADGADPRVAAAAVELADRGLTPVVVATVRDVTAAAATAGVRLRPAVEIVSPSDLRASGAGAVLDARLDTMTAERACSVRDDPLYLAVAAVPAGLADACVAGSVRSTADVVRAALCVVGTAAHARCLTSSFLMELPDGTVLSYADCAVLPEPTPDELAEVAIASSRTHRMLTNSDPVVAMLSFSSKGSARHSSVEAVRRATELVRDRAPDLPVDGELQFDAALVESIGRGKSALATVAGRANVMVFPNLSAANIGYKITERLAGARAYGPILQGLVMPVNDLSRGCSSADIVNVAVISALQAQVAVSGY